MITDVPSSIRQIFEISGIAGNRVPRKFWLLIKYRPEVAFFGISHPTKKNPNSRDTKFPGYPVG